MITVTETVISHRYTCTICGAIEYVTIHNPKSDGAAKMPKGWVYRADRHTFTYKAYCPRCKYAAPVALR